MKKDFFKCLVIGLAVFFFFYNQVSANDVVKHTEKNTLEQILKKGELRVGFEATYMPFEMTDKKGQFIGFDIDIAKEIAAAMGVKFVPVNTEWEKIIPSLVANKFDIIISGMTVTQERNLRINFSNSYFTVGQSVLINKKHEHSISSYKDLNVHNQGISKSGLIVPNLDEPRIKPYIVTSVKGTTGELAVREKIPGCTYRPFKNEIDAAFEVVNNKADAFVFDLPFCVAFMAKYGNDRLILLQPPFTHEYLALGVRKGDYDLVNWLNNFLAQIKIDGRYDTFFNKWFKNTDWILDVEMDIQ